MFDSTCSKSLVLKFFERNTNVSNKLHRRCLKDSEDANCWFSAKVFRIIPLQFIILISSTMQTGCRTKTYSLKSNKNFFTFDWVVKRSNGNSVTIATLQRPLKYLWHANSPIKLTIKLTETIKPAAKSLMYILMAQQIRKKSKKKNQ